MDDEAEIETVPDHKLVGYLRTVLTINEPIEDVFKTLSFGSKCRIFGDGSDVGFHSENGVVLSSSIDSKSKLSSPAIGKSKLNCVSVVRQLHQLVTHKCVKIVALLVGIFEEEKAVVVLVDVYLPIALWSSGWQFPKSRSNAGSLFRHLSCDWEKRRSVLVCSDSNAEHKFIWNISDCHVLGCKLHSDVHGSSQGKFFELHEIFKCLPSVGNEGIPDSSRVRPADASCSSGVWDLSDDVLISILTALSPRDLLSVSATCHHLRSLAASIMPCMKLKLFPHQQAAVEWMLQRERKAEVLPHPLYMKFVTQDGFDFFINNISGEIVTGLPPTNKDFCGGMFCDEPGLGKTITALSLILKTQGTLADPPDGVQVSWCIQNGDQRCGYYEINGENVRNGDLSGKRTVGQKVRRGQLLLDDISSEDVNYSSPKRARSLGPAEQISRSDTGFSNGITTSSTAGGSAFATSARRCTRSLSRVQRNLLYTYEESSNSSDEGKNRNCLSERKHAVEHPEQNETWINENWVQCDECRKWRKLTDQSMAAVTSAWFCSMNTVPLYQSCSDPEETWNKRHSITYFPGFYTKGAVGGKTENVAFFICVLKDHYASMNFETKKALTWLAKLSPEKLSQMETTGLISPVLNARVVSNRDTYGYHKVFQALGLIKRVEKGVSKWYYPLSLNNFVFDLEALTIALREPVDLFRLYLSRATLVVVPANLVDHWKTQILSHVRPDQLNVYVWTDNKKPSARNLAWDYDIVITTFSRLSAEWGPRKRSALMQVHWLRVMLDEGHTLGSSLNMTNKLQMAISLVASNRWLLTGTPTPNTPSSQLSHLQPMLKFLHEEVYGQNHKSWEAGIVKPFEAEMEEGRLQLLRLLCRCMISARKIDLRNIPPCIKKVRYLDFTEHHAKSYNELVVTVQRNILMADWNDPSHVESLLNPKQWKFRTTTIRNVRLSCCVAGHIKVTEAGHDIQETMDILVENGLDPISQEYTFIKYNLLNGGDCMRCQEWCRLPVITPCRHLLCLDCVALDSEKCTFPGCGNLYEMQSPEILTRPENPNPKWPVPKDLIELQPSYNQDDWDPDWQSTSSSKVSYLVHRLNALQEANRKIEFTIGTMQEDELYSSYNKISSNALFQQESSRPSTDSSRILPEKVLIFSQFLEHIHVIEQQLTVAGIKFTGMYSPMHSSNKMKSLAIFQHDASCLVLLMDGSAALGLDLSFVTHVFLMEPIWDRSMEEQVISRAHRMGASRPINVETLAMRGTIEEQMLGFLQDSDACRRFLKDDSSRTGREGARPHRSLHDFAESNYLAQLSFVRKHNKV